MKLYLVYPDYYKADKMLTEVGSIYRLMSFFSISKNPSFLQVYSREGFFKTRKKRSRLSNNYKEVRRWKGKN